MSEPAGKLSKRNGVEISVWLIRAGLSQGDIKRATRLSRSVVSATILGKRNNREVLWFLVNHCCPVELLELPKDMWEEA